MDGYLDNPVCDWLATPADEVLTGTKDKLDDLPRQLDPLTCDEEWLDYLAALCGATGNYWQKDWPELAKRIFLSESYKTIWPGKGTQEIMSFVLITLDILHVIRPKSSFILGESKVGDELGLQGWQYEIFLPSAYFGTSVANTVIGVNDLFGPCWCVSELVYDDKYFTPRQLLSIDEDSLLQVGDSTALEI